jgi:hypothetical protein
MYPPATSFIPVQVALAKYWQVEGLKAIFQNYPFWYLGTTPFRYLAGPIIPGLLVLINSIFPKLDFFIISYILIILSFLIGTIALFFLVKKLGGDKRLGLIISFLFLLGPIFIGLFPFAETSSLISFFLLPLILINYIDFLKNINLKTSLILCISITFVILINIMMVFNLILALIVILLSQADWKNINNLIKKTGLIVVLCLGLATYWYTPGFWLQVILAPSLAGKSLFQVLSQLGQLLPLVLALSLAIFSKKVIKSDNKIFKFSFYWLLIFGFLSLFRFISDPDFWIDWTAYAKELQLGLAVFVGLLLYKLFKNTNKAIISRIWQISAIIVLYLALWLFFIDNFISKHMRRPIKNSVEYKISEQLTKLVNKNDIVYLSGTPVFWLNSFFNIKQVRGGNDKVSVNDQWRSASWEIREGDNIKESLEWLLKLNINWLVVHTKESDEYYYDFKYPDKFEASDQFLKVYEEKGNIIYKVVNKD